MELLLKQNIEHLGRLGDVVKVKPGYARNYLLPRGLAVAVRGQGHAAGAHVSVPGGDAIEVNISCPTRKPGGGNFALNEEHTYQVVKLCREATQKPMWAKLSPNAGDISAVAEAAGRRLVPATLELGGSFDAVAGTIGLRDEGAPEWTGLDVGSPFDDIQWSALLRSASALEMYRQRHGRRRHRRRPAHVGYDGQAQGRRTHPRRPGPQRRRLRADTAERHLRYRTARRGRGLRTGQGQC